MNQLQKQRYQRQIQLSDVGEIGQEKLLAARVLVIGAGGLAATLLPILVASGVGFIRIYDGDRIEITNLHRQTLYRMQDVGKFKAQCAQAYLQQLNSESDIEICCEYLHSANLEQACQDIDLIVDAADRLSTTYLLSNFAFQHNIPLMSASVLAQHGYVGAFCGGAAPSYRAVFPQLMQHNQNCQITGVLPSAVATLASLQAHMVIHYFLNLSPQVLGQLISVNLKTWHISSLRFDQAQEPTDQIQWLHSLQLQADDLILELRSQDEMPNDQFLLTQRVSLEDLTDLVFTPNKRLICVCKTGFRAIQAWQILTQRGYQQVFVLDH